MNTQSLPVEFDIGPCLSSRISGDPELECIGAARELQMVLEEESELLRRFAGAELVRLLSRKEFSIEDLFNKLEGLKASRGGKNAVTGPLREILEKIEAMNRSNRIFIQSSLSHWQDLLSLLCPTGYGPTAEMGKSGTPAPKGLSFSREI